MKVIHLGDDNIFMDAAKRQFDQCDLERNDLLIWSDKTPLKKTKSEIKYMLSYTSSDSIISEAIRDYDLIVLHSLTVANAHIVNNLIKSHQKTVWMLHGYEAYTTSAFKSKDLYSSKSRAFDNNENFIKNVARPIVERFKTTQNKQVLAAAKKVDYLGSLYKEEHEFICSKLKMGAQWFEFTYYPISQIIGHNDQLVEGTDILLGNSASLSNNHLDLIDKLQQLNLEDRKVVCPLSYGDEKYAEQVIEYSKKHLGKNFFPLKEFIEIESYNKILNSCSICIMNHYRQQAVGTVLTMIYKGAKVYLNEKNSLYHFLKRIGVKVFSLLEENISLTPLTKKDKQANQQIIKSMLEETILVDRLKSVLRSI